MRAFESVSEKTVRWEAWDGSAGRSRASPLANSWRTHRREWRGHRLEGRRAIWIALPFADRPHVARATGSAGDDGVARASASKAMAPATGSWTESPIPRSRAASISTSRRRPSPTRCRSAGFYSALAKPVPSGWSISTCRLFPRWVGAPALRRARSWDALSIRKPRPCLLGGAAGGRARDR